MRKLLILVLVLGMAPLAGAVVSFVTNSATVNLGESVTVSVSSDVEDAAWTGYLGYTPGLASLSTVTALTAAGQDAAVTPSPFGWTGYYKIDAADMSDPFTSVDAGVQFTGNLVAGLTTGSYTINLWDINWSVLQDSFTLTIVPEPITMALLGLGGLLIRRRK